MSNPKWTQQEIDTLIDLKTRGLSGEAISRALGRSIDSCTSKWRHFNLTSGEKVGDVSLLSGHWTEEDMQILYSLRRGGVPYRLIAVELKRTEAACKGKYQNTQWKDTEYHKIEHDNLDKRNEAVKDSVREKYASALDKRLHVYKMSSDILSDKLVQSIEPLLRVKPPTYNHTAKQKKHQDEDMVLILSDIHIGAHHTLEETGGLCEFNEEILESRLTNLQYSVKDIYELHSQLYAMPVLHIACLGDIVAGMNASGEWSQNYINMAITEQVAKGFKLISDMINYWLTIFPKIKFYGIRGNHGRTAPRGIEKDHVNWDVVTYDFLKHHFSNNPRIEFVVPRAWWMLETIRNHKFLMVHGDDLKSKGLPVKGLLDFEKEMVGIMREIPDYTLAGHFHNSCELTTNNGRVIINGSVVGGDVYSLKTIHRYSKPEQTIFGVHDIHGMTWKYNINLDHERKI